MADISLSEARVISQMLSDYGQACFCEGILFGRDVRKYLDNNRDDSRKSLMIYSMILEVLYGLKKVGE